MNLSATWISPSWHWPKSPPPHLGLYIWSPFQQEIIWKLKMKFSWKGQVGIGNWLHCILRIITKSKTDKFAGVHGGIVLVNSLHSHSATLTSWLHVLLHRTTECHSFSISDNGLLYVKVGCIYRRNLRGSGTRGWPANYRVWRIQRSQVWRHHEVTHLRQYLIHHLRQYLRQCIRQYIIHLLKQYLRQFY